MLEEEQEQQNVEVINQNLVETKIKILGDKTTISQVVQLLAYIRHAIKYNLNTHIDVQIGKYVMNTPFAMEVNGQEIQDLVTQKTAEIN